MNEMTYAEAIKRQNQQYYAIYVRSVLKDMEFNLDFYEFGELMARPCDYCGGHTTGLDRKDNTRGYVSDNVTPACRRCNTMKGANVDYIEMKELGLELAESDYEAEYLS
jgi:hypothetical protein